MKNIFKIIIAFLVITIFLLLLIIFYSNIGFKKQEPGEVQEQKNIIIDEYNFKELEKAKPILDNIEKDAKKFYSLKEFNSIYNTRIEPIKNCYYISNVNGNEPYIFGFKLESEKYKNKYGTGYYIYPKYDLAVEEVCFEDPYPCSDLNYDSFIKTISNPCIGGN